MSNKYFPEGHAEGTEVLVLTYDNQTKDSAWMPGKLVEYVGSVDRPYRVRVTSAKFPKGVDAAPECVKLKS